MCDGWETKKGGAAKRERHVARSRGEETEKWGFDIKLCGLQGQLLAYRLLVFQGHKLQRIGSQGMYHDSQRLIENGWKGF